MGRKQKNNKSNSAARHTELTSAPKRNMQEKMVAALIVCFAVLMALSMILPSLASIFSHNSTPKEEAPGSVVAAESKGSDASSQQNQTADAAADPTTVDGVFSLYTQEISSLEAKLAKKEDNLAYLLNLGKTYMNCAYAASAYITNDDENAKVAGYYDKAMEYFDRYLALNDAQAVKVDRALCQLFKGESQEAVAALLKLTQEDSNYAPAWANLGLAYEITGDKIKAKEAYTKAQEVDPKDEYGAHSFATQRINNMEAQSAQNNSDQADTTASNTGASALSDALSKEAK